MLTRGLKSLQRIEETKKNVKVHFIAYSDLVTGKKSGASLVSACPFAGETVL